MGGVGNADRHRCRHRIHHFHEELKSMRSLESNRGFSMLEVLVTLVLISLALLGTAAMQIYGVKVTQGGQFRAQAVLIGTDFMERLEANNVGALASAYVGSLPATSGGPECTTENCLPAQLARFDLEQLQLRLAEQLPNATASVTRTGGGPWVYTLTINWQERAYRASGTTSASQQTVESFSYTLSRTIYDRAVMI
jgi:type IV pilus assembly protein PilV